MEFDGFCGAAPANPCRSFFDVKYSPAVAGAVTRNTKRPADLAARYGGEEFVAVLPNTPAEGAVNLAEMIRNDVLCLLIPHQQSPANDYVTLSLGVASVIPLAAHGPEILIKAADTALYDAKAQGRNRVVFKRVPCPGIPGRKRKNMKVRTVTIDSRVALPVYWR